MNFFAHAAIAAAFERDGHFVYGAMLPDFFGMVRLRRPHSDDPEVRAGIHLHHETDRCFHAAPDFLELTAVGTRELVDADVRLGRARAVAHVGIELLLDGVLLETPQYRQSYLEGLAARHTANATLDLDEPSRAKLAELGDRIASFGIPHGYADPDIVADRLERILAPRKRLSLSSDEVPRVRRWLESARPRVRDRAARMVDHTHRMLR